MNKEFSKLCTPAKIYFALAIFACIVALLNQMPVLAVAVKVLFAFVWTFILNWLCQKGFESVSWFFVLLPFVMMLLAFLGIMHLKKSEAFTQKKPKHHTKK